MFDWASANPPFGRVATSSDRRAFEFAVIEVASQVADNSVFILPQNSTSFRAILLRAADLRIARRIRVPNGPVRTMRGADPQSWIGLYIPFVRTAADPESSREARSDQ